MRFLLAFVIRLTFGMVASGVVGVLLVLVTWGSLEIVQLSLLTSALGAGLGVGMALGFLDLDGDRRDNVTGLVIGLVGGLAGTWLAVLVGEDFLEFEVYSREFLSAPVFGGITGAATVCGGYYLYRATRTREY